ncbi:phosphoribulokinase [Actinoallomurus sp. NPDC052274]|uniref:phosphoribulokinase n=1 Tax=Actinoallomurus sp. NPDC052274 TaxID=3155420 RepID=UPI003441A7A8
MSEIDRRRVQDLAALVRAAPVRAGRTRVVAIDGRSGSGKSTLAASLHRETGAAVVSLEDLYGGWDGLERGVDLLVAEVLAPLAAGRAAYVPRYDWATARWRTPIELPPPALLIVEGVGAGARRAAGYASVLVWLEAGERTRRRRALDRDGDAYAPHWERWAAQEAELLARETTWDRADVVLDTEAGPGHISITGSV